MSAKSKRTHRAFDKIDCPVPRQLHKECTSGKGGKVQHGSVPGIKRHVIKVHGVKDYNKIEWPPIRKEGTSGSRDGRKVAAGLQDKKVDELRSLARQRGVDPTGLKKDDLVEALS